MIRGRELVSMGWPQGEAIGILLELQQQVPESQGGPSQAGLQAAARDPERALIDPLLDRAAHAALVSRKQEQRALERKRERAARAEALGRWKEWSQGLSGSRKILLNPLEASAAERAIQGWPGGEIRKHWIKHREGNLDQPERALLVASSRWHARHVRLGGRAAGGELEIEWVSLWSKQELDALCRRWGAPPAALPSRAEIEEQIIATVASYGREAIRRMISPERSS